MTASVSGSDNGDQLSYDIHPSNVQIEPGRAAFVKATLKPRQIIWFGSKDERPYTLAVQAVGRDAARRRGHYVQRGFLPGWLATCLGIFLALAITFVTMWFAFQPRVDQRRHRVQGGRCQHARRHPSASPQPLESAEAAEPYGAGGGVGPVREGGWRRRWGAVAAMAAKAPEPTAAGRGEGRERAARAHILLRNLATRLAAPMSPARATGGETAGSSSSPATTARGTTSSGIWR